MKKQAEIRLLRRVEALENAVRHLLDKQYPLMDCIGKVEKPHITTDTTYLEVSKGKFKDHVNGYLKPYKLEFDE